MNQSMKQLELALGQGLLEKIDFRSLIEVLWLNKWFIISIMSLCFLMGVFSVYTKIPLYSSNVLLQIEDHGNNIFSLDKFSPSTLLSSKDAGSAAVGVQTALIKSRYILEPVVQELHLDISTGPVYFPFLGAWYAMKHTNAANKPWWASSQFAWGGEEIKVASFNVPNAKQNKRFNLVVTAPMQYELYDDKNQLILHGETGRLIKKTIDGDEFSIEVTSFNAHVNTHFYIVKNSVQQIADQLASQIHVNDLSQEMELRNPTGIFKVSITGANPHYIMSLLNQIARIVVDKNIKKKSEETRKTFGFINRQIPQVKQSLDDAENALSAYLVKKGMLDLNSESKLLSSQLFDIYKNLNTIKMIKASASKKYTSAHPAIISLHQKQIAYQNELNLLQKKISRLPLQNQESMSLLREVRLKGQLYLLLLQKIYSLQIAQESIISDIVVLGEATYPIQPLPAKNVSTLVFSLLFGLALGSLFIFVQQFWNRKIVDPAVLENQFGLTNMAIIPYSEIQTKLWTGRSSQQKVQLLACTYPKDMSIEALRSFRTGLQFLMIDKGNRIITVSGISPGVGKSFVSANISYLLADAGKKVLLIDADLRRGHLKDYFNVDSSSMGLSEVICGACTLEEALIKGPLANFEFLSTGVYPPNPSELLMSQQFQSLLEQLSPHYDLIIIDTPPVLAVTDPVVIGRYASANFLVFASSAHLPGEIETALKRFESSGVKISGAIFNFSKRQKGIYGIQHIYKYSYDYS